MKQVFKMFIFVAFILCGTAVYPQTNDTANQTMQTINEALSQGDCDRAQRAYNVWKVLTEKTNNSVVSRIEECKSKKLTEGAIQLIPIKKEDFIVHKVNKKETLFSLTQKYNITYDELYELNPLLKEGGLRMNMEVKIPKKSVSAQSNATSSTNSSIESRIAECKDKKKLNQEPVNDEYPELKVEKKNTPKFIFHEIKEEETLYSISRKYGTTREEIIRLNPDAKNGIKVGSILIIKEPVNDEYPELKVEKKNTSKCIFHEIKEEETLYSISRKYGTTREEIIRLNPDAKNGIKVGRILIILSETSNADILDE